MNQTIQNTSSSVEKVFQEFQDLKRKDIITSFLKGAVWGFACLILICISAFLVDIMRTRIFYSSNIITTYPQQRRTNDSNRPVVQLTQPFTEIPLS
jgi:hypothetical protein